MARLLGPIDAVQRYAALPDGAPAVGKLAVFYAASTGGTLADIATYDGTATPGASVAASTLTVDVDGLIPIFWLPDGADNVWVSVNGGTRVRVSADVDAQLDALETADLGFETPAGAQAKATAAQVAAIAASQPLGVGATNYGRPPITSWVTLFQPGHSFTNLGSGLAVVADDTADYALASQSLAVTTKTDNTAGSVQRTGMSAINATGQSLIIVCKIDDITNLTELIVYLANDAFTNFYQWTVQDGGLDAQRFFKSGEWSIITLSFADAAVTGSPTRNGQTALRLRTRCANGTATTIRWQAVGLTPEQSIFSNGVVSISFDDALATQYSNARPVLDAHGFPATAYLIADVVGTAGFMTLAQCRQLEDVNGWDMAAHSYTLADHGTGLASLSTSALELNLSRMRSWLETNGFRGSRHLAYPLGEFSAAQIAITRRYFDSGRTIISRTRNETLPAAHPFKLRSPSLTNSVMPASTWTAEIDDAFTNKTWLHLTFHGVVPSSPTANDILTSDFTTIINYIATKGMPVRTVRQVLDAARGGGA